MPSAEANRGSSPTRGRQICYSINMTVSIRTHLHSSTIELPEAESLVGKDVRITVVEEPANTPPRDLTALDRIAGKIDLNFDAVQDLRRRSSL